MTFIDVIPTFGRLLDDGSIARVDKNDPSTWVWFYGEEQIEIDELLQRLARHKITVDRAIITPDFAISVVL
jgi:hypothetical protein